MQKFYKRKKILHLITSLEVGGVQHGLLLGLPKLDNKKYEHAICSLTSKMPMGNDFKKKNIKIFTLNINSKKDFLYSIRLRNIINNYKPDILHTYLIHANILGRIFGKICDVETIISSERTIGQANWYERFLTKITNPLVDIVEVNSKKGKDTVHKNLKVPKEKLRVIYSGINVKKYQIRKSKKQIKKTLQISNSQKVILCAGRLRAVKGINFGIESFYEIQKSINNAIFLIIGDGEDKKKLEKISNQLHLNDKIKFLGVRNDLPELFSISNIVIMPSLTEGFPRIAIESMAAGKPIVATRVGGTPEAIKHKFNGILVPSKKPKIMANWVIKLLKDQKFSMQLGINGKKSVSNKFTLEKYLQEVDMMYSKSTSRERIS
ncbi:MAG: glycosyltransferase [Dehalococcoidia bacterium]